MRNVAQFICFLVMLTMSAIGLEEHVEAQPAMFAGTGILPGGAFSFATNVSGDGSVVLGSSDSSNGQIGFKWTAAAGMQTVPFPRGHGNGARGVNGVSRDGSIIVRAAFGDVAFQWTAATGSPIARNGLPSFKTTVLGPEEISKALLPNKSGPAARIKLTQQTKM